MKTGRPRLYDELLRRLDRKTVYTPALIVRVTEQSGWFSPDIVPEQRPKIRLKMRHTFAIYARKHKFPAEGDGLVKIPRQAPVPGWYGHRWQEPLKDGSSKTPGFLTFPEGDYYKIVDPEWTAEELLDTEGLFPLDQVIKILDPSRLDLARKRQRAESREQSLFKVNGIWYVRMVTFSRFYCDTHQWDDEATRGVNR